MPSITLNSVLYKFSDLAEKTIFVALCHEPGIKSSAFDSKWNSIYKWTVPLQFLKWILWKMIFKLTFSGFFFFKIHVHVKYVCCFKSQSIDFKIESERNYFGCKYLLMKQIRTRYIWTSRFLVLHSRSRHSWWMAISVTT